jgi:hypothetical protein
MKTTLFKNMNMPFVNNFKGYMRNFTQNAKGFKSTLMNLDKNSAEVLIQNNMFETYVYIHDPTEGDII